MAIQYSNPYQGYGYGIYVGEEPSLSPPVPHEHWSNQIRYDHHEFDNVREALNAFYRQGFYLKQITRMGISATPEEPFVEEIAIMKNDNLKRLPVEVLKLVADEEYETSKTISFNYHDRHNFSYDDYIKFKNSLRLKTSYDYEMEYEGELDDGDLWSVEIPLDEFRRVEEINVVAEE